MRGILINNLIHTGNDLNLVMTSKSLPAPQVQSQKVEIPGRNGSLDMSEYLTGEPTYDNRTLSFSFFGTGSRDTVLFLIDTMLEYHGRYVTIIVDDINNWFYEGRVEVDYVDKYHYVEFKLTVDAQPFRYAVNIKKYEYSNVNSKDIFLRNEGTKIIPTIVITAETKITYKGMTYTLSAGEYDSETLLIEPGGSTWTVTTTGRITVTYREARL